MPYMMAQMAAEIIAARAKEAIPQKFSLPLKKSSGVPRINSTVNPMVKIVHIPPKKQTAWLIRRPFLAVDLPLRLVLPLYFFFRDSLEGASVVVAGEPFSSVCEGSSASGTRRRRVVSFASH